MKVGQGRSAEQSSALGKAGEKRQERARGEKGREFSELMDKDRRPLRESVGDEQGRRLEEGLVQREGRDEETRLLDRTKRGDGESRRIAAESWGEGEALEEDPVEGEEADRAVADLRFAAEESTLKGEGRFEIGAVTQGADEASKMIMSRPQTESEALEAMCRQIVNAVQVGEDGQARRVVFLDVTVPGHGEVRIRLRREGGGLEVRMRADNDGLAQTLRKNAAQLRRRAGDQGVLMTSVQVIR